MKTVNGLKQFCNLGLAILVLLFLATSCTKNDDDVECPECESIVIEDILNPLHSSGTNNPDSTNIVIEDILNP